MTEEKIRTGNAQGHFVICDIQETYSENLLTILMERLSGKFQFHIFHDFEKMKAFSRSSEIQILLTAEEFGVERIKEIASEKTFIISEEEKKSEDGKTAFIYRYQSAGKIISEMFSRDGSCQRKQKPRIRDEPAVSGVIGIYSPIHRIGKTRFALRLGRQLAAKYPVLYLNLEGCAGGNYYFSHTCGYDMGDLLYYVRQEGESQGIRISIMTDQTKGLDYIFPMKNEIDFRSVRRDEWITLINTIQEKCIYETIILDLGDGINGLYEILRKCEKIYTPYIEDGVSAAKLEQYEKSLQEAGYGDILSRTVKRKIKRIRHADERNGGIYEPDGTAL